MSIPVSTIQKVEVYKIGNGSTYDTLEEAEYQEARSRFFNLCCDLVRDNDDFTDGFGLAEAISTRSDALLTALSEYKSKRQVWEAEQARREKEAATQTTLPVRPRKKRS